MKIFQIFVAFSECPNFMTSNHAVQITMHYLIVHVVQASLNRDPPQLVPL